MILCMGGTHILSADKHEGQMVSWSSANCKMFSISILGKHLICRTVFDHNSLISVYI